MQPPGLHRGLSPWGDKSWKVRVLKTKACHLEFLSCYCVVHCPFTPGFLPLPNKGFVLLHRCFFHGVLFKTLPLSQQEFCSVTRGGAGPEPDVPAVKWGVRTCLVQHGHGKGVVGWVYLGVGVRIACRSVTLSSFPPIGMALA